MTQEQKNDLRIVAALLTVAAYALEPIKKLKGMDEHDPMSKVIHDYKDFLRRVQNLE